MTKTDKYAKFADRQYALGSKQSDLAIIHNWLQDRPYPVAVQAGHFLLLVREGQCLPCIAEELDSEDAKTSPESAIHAWLSQFPRRTWGYGVELLRSLISSGVDSSIFVVVNDWQYVKRSPGVSPGRLRKLFYAKQRELFESYGQTLEEAGLTKDCLAKIGKHPAFVSETWLRNRIQRRLPSLLKAGNGTNEQLSWIQNESGQNALMFYDLDRACQLLFCGQADCAGEMMELICQLYEQGFRTLVNFIPQVCETPVNEGTRRAIALFRYLDFTALNVCVPFAKDGSDDIQGRGWQMYAVCGRQQKTGGVESFVTHVT